jgi:hypothetical protein
MNKNGERKGHGRYSRHKIKELMRTDKIIQSN